LTIIHNDRDIFQISELIEKRFIAEGRRKKEEGRRKKEDVILAIVSAIKDVRRRLGYKKIGFSILKTAEPRLLKEIGVLKSMRL
jgi:hypothetical protein